MLTKRETNTAFLTHISAFFSLVFPFGSILGPLVMWSVNKERSRFVDENGVEAINFNISYVLYMVVLGMLAFPFAFGSFFNYMQHIDDFDGFNVHFNTNFGFETLFGILSIGSIIGVIAFIKLILIIVAAVKASRGEVYKYPLTIKFVK